MKCSRCEKSKALKGKELCGICEIITSGEMMTQHPDPVKPHYNYGLGRAVQDKEDLRRAYRENPDLLSEWDGIAKV